MSAGFWRAAAARAGGMVRLAEPRECLFLSAWDFKARMKLHPEIAMEILPVVVKRFRETNEPKEVKKR